MFASAQNTSAFGLANLFPTLAPEKRAYTSINGS